MSPSYVDSYYSRTLASSEAYPPADGPISTDICIVGAGLAGLTAALELVRSGRRVVRYDGGAAQQAFRDLQEAKFGRRLRYLPREETRSLLRSPKYHSALLEEDSFHFHPLNYGRALAREIVRLGGRICEASPVVSCDFEGPRKRIR